MQNVTATLEDSLKVSYKPKCTHTTQPSNHAPWYLPKGTEKVYPPKHLHRGDDSSFIQHCQKLETIKRSSGEWL